MKSRKPVKFSSVAIIFLIFIAVAATALFLRPRSNANHIRHIVLISIDTCRRDHISCYGYRQNTTPNIDAIAAEGVLFTNALSPVPLTLPAHCSMLTGTNPIYHGVRDNADYRLQESATTLAEILQADGFATAAFVGAFVLDSQFGLDQGFETYNDTFEEQVKSVAATINQRRGAEISNLACEWLTRNKSQPFFLFLHYFNPHGPYEPPAPFAESYADYPYAGEIAYTDYCIGLVVDKLKDLKLYDSTLIIITADHGESLGQHSETTHGYFIYNSTIDIPLIFKTPGATKPRKIDQLASLIDIVPTVCSLIGTVPPPNVHGQDLSGFFQGQAEIENHQRYVYCESLLPTQYDCSALLGLVDDHWKYIQAPQPELYSLDKDPEETINLAEKYPDRSRLMAEQLLLILDKQQPDHETGEFLLDKQSRRQLESLGYVATTGVRDDIDFFSTKSDPKERIDLHEKLIMAKWFDRIKQYSDADAVVKQIVAAYPRYLLNNFLLGKIAFEKTDTADSVEYFSKFLAQTQEPNDLTDKSIHYLQQYIIETHNYLGMAFSQQALHDKAITHYSKALQIEPALPNIHHNLANIYLKQDRLDKAIKHYTKALQLNPTLPEAYCNLGVALSQQGSFDKAIQNYKKALHLRRDWQKAQENLAIAENNKEQLEKTIISSLESLRKDPNQPGLHKDLGIIFALRHNLEKAVHHWNKALHLKPGWPKALNNLAWLKAVYKNEKFHDPNKAVQFAEKACKITEYKEPNLLDTLSVAYAAAGRFPQAIETARKALDLANATNQLQLTDQIKEHLELFEAEQPYYQAR